MTDAMTRPTSGMVTDDDAREYKDAEGFCGQDQARVIRRLLADRERTLGLAERYATRNGIHQRTYEHPYWCGYFPSEDGGKRDEDKCDCFVKALKEAGRAAS